MYFQIKDLTLLHCLYYLAIVESEFIMNQIAFYILKQHNLGIPLGDM